MTKFQIGDRVAFRWSLVPGHGDRFDMLGTVTRMTGTQAWVVWDPENGGEMYHEATSPVMKYVFRAAPVGPDLIAEMFS